MILFEIILGFITAFLLTYLAIPYVIRIARKNQLFDKPGWRKSHSGKIPALGGIALFAGVTVALVLWTPAVYFDHLQYLLIAFLLVFLLGVWDDLMTLPPTRKLIGELLIASILVFLADIRINSLFGIFGIGEISLTWSILLSLFTIIVIINAFNLIDGINGLSGSITLLVSLIFGSWFYLEGMIELAMVAFTLAGALIAFLKFNFSPAKIFMGDTGALFCGLIVSVLTIKFIDMHRYLSSPYAFKAVPAVAIGILILPLFDTLRVFIMRLLKGKSPLHPDRSHIHHLMVDSGLSHMQATGILVVINLFFILISIKFQAIGTVNLILIITGLAFALTLILTLIFNRKVLSRT